MLQVYLLFSNSFIFKLESQVLLSKNLLCPTVVVVVKAKEKRCCGFGGFLKKLKVESKVNENEGARYEETIRLDFFLNWKKEKRKVWSLFLTNMDI